MRRLALICFLFVSLQSTIKMLAQTKFPMLNGEDVRYSCYIEMPHSYISGICLLMKENEVIKGSLFNEFGITVLDFTYSTIRQKVKLHNVIKMLDKWYIRRVLRKDLAQLMICLQKGETQYYNERQHITYKFTPAENEITE